MTNYEKIKNMTIDEMTDWLDKMFNEDREDWQPIGCFSCCNYGTHHQNERECGNCEFYGGLKNWLNKEAE